MKNTTKNNILKSTVLTTLLATSKTLANTELNKTNNATNNIQWNSASSTNYTAPNRWLNHTSQNYTGRYDPTKHTLEHNRQRAREREVIRAKEYLSNKKNGVRVIQDNEWKVILRKNNGRLSISIEPIGENLQFWGCKKIATTAIYSIGIAAIIGCALDPMCDYIMWRMSVPRYILDIFKTGAIPTGVAVLATWLCDHAHSISNSNTPKTSYNRNRTRITRPNNLMLK